VATRLSQLRILGPPIRNIENLAHVLDELTHFTEIIGSAAEVKLGAVIHSLDDVSTSRINKPSLLLIEFKIKVRSIRNLRQVEVRCNLSDYVTYIRIMS